MRKKGDRFPVFGCFFGYVRDEIYIPSYVGIIPFIWLLFCCLGLAIFKSNEMVHFYGHSLENS